MRLQLLRIDVDHDLSVAAAVGGRHRRAGNTGNLISNLKLEKVVELRLVQPLALHGEQANRQIRRVGLQHHRRQRSFRQPPQIGHRQIGNLSYVRVGVGPGLKINLDQADAGHRPRFHMIDAAAKSKKPLESVRDVSFDLLGRHAIVKSGDQHHRNVDRRKHVHRHLQQAREAQDANEQADHYDEVGMS